MAKVVFVGNCQIGAISHAYQTFVAPWTGDTAIFVDAYGFDPAVAAPAFQDADIVVGQVAESRSNIDIDEVPANIVKHRVPVVTGGFLWPFGGQPHPKSISLPHLPLGPYSAELGDSYLNRMINKGVNYEEALRKYLALDINKLVNLDRLLELNLEKQRNRDRATGFRSAEIIEKYLRDEHIFLTPYHPNLRVARYLIQETFQKMNVDQAAIDRLENWLTTTPFPSLENPIHPSVQRHFGLSYAGPDYKYRFHNEGSFTFEQYVGRYLRFEWNAPLEEAFSLGRERKLAAAVEKFAVGLEQSPRSAAGFLGLSGVLDQLGKVDEAIAAALAAVDRDPSSAPTLRHLGILMGRTGQVQEAERLLRRAIEISPGAAEYYVALSHMLHRQQRIDDAIAAVQQAIERDPEAPRTLVHYGTLLDINNEAQEAERVLRRAIALAADDEEARSVLSRVLARQGKLSEAIAEIRRALELKPNTAPFVRYLGHLLARDGQDTEAEAVLRSALELSPGDPGICGDLCHVLDRQNRRGEAVALLRQIIDGGNHDPHFRAQLGHLLSRSGDLTGAEQEFRAATELNPSATGFRASLADVINRQGKRDEAAALLQQIIASGASDAHIHDFLAHILLHSGDLQGAEREFRSAMKKSDDGARFRASLADVLQRLGRHEEAAALS